MKYAHIIKSACHCGNIHLELHTNRDHSTLAPRICQCTLCRKHGASWISDLEGEARVRIADKALANFYRFGLKTADFILCKTCGVLVVAVCEINGRKHAVLNSTVMVDTPFAAPVFTDFEGENVQTRLARRERNWTGNVIVE